MIDQELLGIATSLATLAAVLSLFAVASYYLFIRNR